MGRTATGRNERMDALRRTRALLLNMATTSEELEPVLQTVCRGLCRQEGITGATVRLFDPGSRRDVARCSEGGSDGIEAPLELMEAGRDEPLVDEDADAKRLHLPLAGHGRLMGALSLVTEEKFPPDPEALAVLTEVASILALTIENRLLCAGLPVHPGRSNTAWFESFSRLHARLNDEINRVDRYGGEFSILTFGGMWDAVADRRKIVVATILQHVRQVDFAVPCGENVSTGMPHTGEEGALAAGRRLCEMLDSHFQREYGVSPETACGVAIYPSHSPFAAGLIEASEIALLHARSNSATVYSYGAIIQAEARTAP